MLDFQDDSNKGTLDFSAQKKAVPTTNIETTAQKYDLALGEDSPGVEAVTAELVNHNKPVLDTRLHAARARDFERTKNSMMEQFIKTQNRALTVEELNFFAGMTEADYNESPDNIMESTYAKKYLQTVITHDKEAAFEKSESVAPEATNQALDVFQEMAARQNIIHTVMNEIDDAEKEQSWGGYLADMGVVGLVPLQQLRLNDLVTKAPTTSVIPGNNLMEQVVYLHSLPPDQFAQEFRAAVDSIGNLQLKKQFANSVLSVSSEDIFTSNATTMLEAIDLAAGAGTLAAKGAKAITRVGKGISRANQLKGLLKGATTAGKNRVLDIADVAEKTGNFEVAAIAGASKRLNGAFNFKDHIHSINNPEKFWTGESNLAKNVTDEVLLRAKARASLADDALGGIDTPDRIDPTRLAQNVQETYDRLQTELRPIQGSILDVDDLGAPVAIPDTQIVQAAGRAPNLQEVERLQGQLKKLRAQRETPGVVRQIKQIEDRISVAGRASAAGTQTVPLPVVQAKTGKTFVVNDADNFTNTTSIEIKVGTRNGGLFPNEAAAAKFARDHLSQYRDVVPVSHGSGYYLSLVKDVPDVLENFRYMELPTDAQSESFINQWIGAFRSQKGALGNEQQKMRLAIAHGSTELESIMSDMAKPIAGLSKSELAEMKTIWEINRDYMDDATGIRGRFYNTASEFEMAFREKFNKIPSVEQAEAYQAYVQLNDMDYAIRSAGWYRDRVRMGIEQFEIKLKPTPAAPEANLLSFEGKLVNSIPWGDQGDNFFRVAHQDADGVWHVVSNKTTDPAKRAAIDDAIKGGAKIIQAGDANLKIPGLDEGGIAFTVVHDYSRGRLSIEAPYRAGGHVINKYSHYIKQPKLVGTGKDKWHVGDTAVFSAKNAADGARYAKVLEEARLKLLRNDPDLDDFVSNNLGEGMDAKAFRALFEPRKNRKGELVPGLDKELPFVATRAGQRTSDVHNLDGVRNKLRDTTKSKYNLYYEMNREYYGERGTDNIPVVSEEEGVLVTRNEGALLDPLSTLSKSSRSMVDVKLKRDYLLRSARTYVEQFRDLMPLKNQAPDVDPTSVLYSGEFLEGADPARLRQAKAVRQSILRYIGTQDADSKTLDWLQAKLSQTSLGKKVNIGESWQLPTMTDAITFGRSIASHAKLGLFNINQLFVQPQTLVNVIAISPRSGAKGFAAYFPTRAALINPKMLEHSTGVARSFGWKDAHYKEMVEGLTTSGWYRVSGDYGVIDDIANPKLFKSSAGRVADAGYVFFKEGEAVNRITAYAAAYDEWRRIAGTGATFDRRARASVLARADDMTQNMSAANNAVWQKGPAGIPAQFFTYQLRMFEQYWGGALTPGEKLRMFAAQTTMYGLPMSAGAATLVWPWQESVREYLIEHNIPYNEGVLGLIANGLPQTLLSGLGLDVEVGARYGAGGMSFLKDWMDGEKTMAELAVGASGTVFGDMASATYPVYRAVKALVSDDPTEDLYSIDADFVINTLQNVTSFSNTAKFIAAMNTGKWMSKHGTNITTVTGYEAFFKAMTGVPLSRETNAFAQMNVLKDHDNARKEISAEVTRLFRKGMGEDDDALRQEYYRKARALAVGAGLNASETSRALRRARQDNDTTLVDKMEKNLLKDLQRRGLSGN